MIPGITAGRAASGGGGIDPYWDEVQSLLHFEGTLGTSTFTDQKGRTWTINGTPVITDSQFRFGASAGAFNGSNQAINCAGNVDFGIGTGDFTVEFWLYPTRLGGAEGLFDNRSASDTGIAIYSSVGSDGRLQVYSNSGLLLITPGALTVNQWVFVQVRRTSGVLSLGINGVEVDTEADARTYAAAPPLRIGSDYGGSQFGQFYMDEFRLTVGVARSLDLPSAAFPDS